MEEEFKRLREPLEKTLLDVRDLVNSIENPFNLLDMGNITQDKPVPNPAQQKFREAQPSQHLDMPEGIYNMVGQAPRPPQSNEYMPNPTLQGTLNRFLNVVTAVNLMIMLVGKDQVQSLVNLLTWKNLVSKDLSDNIREALAFLTSPELGLKYEQTARGPPSITDVIVVLYLISRIAKDSDDPLIMLLLFSYEPVKRFLEFKRWGGGGGT